jgi:hypothetical protein
MTMTTKVAAGLTSAIFIGASATTAFAQCGTGMLIKFDADVLAYETNYTVATYHSAAGSQLTVVGKIVQFCAPLQDLVPDAAKEYTFVFSSLTTAAGTVHTPLGGGTTRHQTSYGSGLFSIYEGMPPNAPAAASAPPNPPNGTVPSTFQDGTLILQGTLANFVTTVTQFGSGTFATSFRADYQFTGPAGGTYYDRIQHWGPGLLGGLWCATGTAGGLCENPAGYSAHPNGKFDIPPVTETLRSTWGMIKQLYR